jgi:hypothetical protein
LPLRFVFALGVCGLIVVGLWLLMPRYWRGRYRSSVDALYGWMGLSRPARRGMYRATLVVAISLTMTVGGAAAAAATVELLGPAHPLVRGALALALGGLLFLTVGVLSVVWFNFHRCMVMPHARGHAGLAMVRRRARRIRRAEGGPPTLSYPEDSSG